MDNKYHPKIIGWRGTMVSKIRKDHGVQVQFPDKGAPEENIITVVGYEKNAITARDEILRIVKEWVRASFWSHVGRTLCKRFCWDATCF